MNLEDALLRGTRAAQPVASAVGDGILYFVTDEDITEQSRGGVWVSYSGPAGSLTAIDGLTGDVTATGPGVVAATIAANAVTTAKILDANVTLAKIVDASAASRLLGRGAASGAGDFQEITLGSGLAMTAQVLSATGGGTAALSGSNLGALASANLSTLGTIDWFCPNGNLTVPAGQQIPCQKLTGPGDIRESFFFFGAGGSVFSGGSGVTMTATTADSTIGATSVTSHVSKIGSVGSGFRFRVRAKTTQQRLTIYTSAWSLEYTVTATFSDGAASPVTITVNTGASVGGGRIIEFLFTGANAYADLQVVVKETIDLGATPNIGFTGISLGT